MKTIQRAARLQAMRAAESYGPDPDIREFMETLARMMPPGTEDENARLLRSLFIDPDRGDSLQTARMIRLGMIILDETAGREFDNLYATYWHTPQFETETKTFLRRYLAAYAE